MSSCIPGIPLAKVVVLRPSSSPLVLALCTDRSVPNRASLVVSTTHFDDKRKASVIQMATCQASRKRAQSQSGGTAADALHYNAKISV